MIHILIGLPILMIIPFLIGASFTCGRKGTISNCAKAYVMGWMILFSLYELVAIPTTFLNGSFHTLTIIWLLLSVCGAIIGMIRLIRSHFRFFLPPKDKWILIIGILILFQIIMVIFLQHIDQDDSFYLGTAMTSLDTNTVFKYNPYTGGIYANYPWRYVFSPFPIFLASISWLCQLHPAIMAHTIWPVVAIILFYSVMGMFGEYFFKDKKKFFQFFFFVNLLTLWGNYSIRTATTFLLVRSWQGKAILACVALPFLFYILMTEKKGVKIYITTWIVVLASCMLSSMGMILSLILLGVYALVALFRKQFIRSLQLLSCCIPCIVFGLIFMNR